MTALPQGSLLMSELNDILKCLGLTVLRVMCGFIFKNLMFTCVAIQKTPIQISSPLTGYRGLCVQFLVLHPPPRHTHLHTECDLLPPHPMLGCALETDLHIFLNELWCVSYHSALCDQSSFRERGFIVARGLKGRSQSR